MTALRIIEAPDPFSDRGEWGAAPGDMWLCTWESHVFGNRAPCWVVRLPGEAWCWHTNEPSSAPDGAFWTVTGEPPRITVHPSINVGPEIWHGWIIDGEMNP